MRLHNITPSSPIPPRLEIDGWARWQLISAGGIIEREGEQHNLLLNQGLDLIATLGLGDFSSGETTGITNYAVVGTGSTLPDPAQTAMVNELGRSNTVPSGYAYSIVRVSPGVYRRTVTREFNYAQANGNLTEWGFSPSGTANTQLAVRELFRDGGGTPIVLTKTSAQKLRISYTMEYRFGPLVATPATFNIAGIGSVSGKYSLVQRARVYSVGSTPEDNVDFLLMTQLVRGIANLMTLTGRGSGVDPAYGNLGGGFGIYPHGAPVEVALTADPYTPGSFRRTASATYSTNAGNFTHYGWALGLGSSNINSTNCFFSGYHFLLDVGKEITTKNDLKTLTLSGFGASWGRV